MKGIKNKINQLGQNTPLLFFISIVCMFLTSTILGLGDWDFRWQSFLGQSIVTKGDFYGLKDLIWGTVGIHSYYDHEWLTNVFFYLLNVIFGPTYSIVVTKVIIELLLGITSYFFVKFFIKDFSKMNITMYLGSMVLTYLYATLLVKPKAYDISVAFMMLLIILLEKYRDNVISFRKFALYLIPLIILWNNIHSGSILLVFVITGAYWLCYWRDWKTILLGLVSIAALGVNPFGYKLIYFDITHNADSVMKTIIRDWHSLDFKMESGVAIGMMIVLILFFLLNMPRTKENFVYVLLFIGFLVMTISSMRHFLYMYPVALILFIKGQFTVPEKLKLIDIKTFGVPTWFITVFTVFLLVLFGVNFKETENEYTMNYITPELNEAMAKTTAETNDGLFTGDVNVWSSGYKSFQSGAFPHTRERVIDSYIMLKGSETQIADIINFYKLDKFLFFKTEKSETGYTLHTNLYDYMINRPDEYVLLYDDDVLVYFVTKEVNDAIK